MSINIKDIQGVFTNADQCDIQENFATVLQNLKSTHGKLEKTFCFGDIFGLDVLDIIESGSWVDTGHVWDDGQWWVDSGSSMTKSIGVSIINLVTYFNSNASAGSGDGSGEGYVFIGVAINGATGVVTLYYWTGIEWENITNLVENTPDTFYHVYDKNPIIQANEIIRFLPGGEKYAGTGSAIHQPTGMWLGYIDRNYFDELYEEGTDYTGGFYLYNNYPTKPDISSSGLNATATVTAGGEWLGSDGDYFYKLSYVYDGINESLLSDEFTVTYTNNTYLQLLLTIDTTDFNLRRTAINVYRSEVGNIGEAADELNGTYDLIHSIDLVRDLDSVDNLEGDTCYCGLRKIYIPEISDATSHGIPGSHFNDWRIIIDSVTYAIDAPGDGYPTQTVYTAQSDISNNHWGVTWKIQVRSTSWQDVWEGTSAYAGEQMVLFDSDTSFAEAVLVNGLITIKDTTYLKRVIDANYLRAVQVVTAFTSDFGTDGWQILTVANGLYYFEESGTDINLYFFDTKISEGSTYSVLNEPAITVNAEYAMYHLNRLWQFGHTVLDPGGSGENEEHDDWLMYSELDQPDVQPVSNAIKISDLTGGKGTGIATSFGSLILLKKNSIHKLLIPDISTPSGWNVSESVFNRGCVADKGYIQVGHKVYFCATDGIYELDVNFEAAADDTPLIQNRISEPINDTYLALNDIDEKPYVSCGYDKINTEIIWRLESTSIWAFNILTKAWREIDTSKTCDIFAYDQYDDLMVFNESDDQVYSINAETGESVGCKVATKFFNVSGGEGQRKGYVRSCTIRYKSDVALLARTYLDNSSSLNVEDDIAPALESANWDTADGWDLSGSSLNHNADYTDTISPSTDLDIETSDIYKVTITLSACTVGNCTYTLGGTAGSTLSSATTYTDYIIATNTNDLIFTPSAASARFNISAVSVERVVGRSLATSSDVTTVKFGVRARCNTFKLEICDLTSSTSDTEIHDIKIETDS